MAKQNLKIVDGKRKSKWNLEEGAKTMELMSEMEQYNIKRYKCSR